MVSERMVDRVIGTKCCAKCGRPVVVESYTIPGATQLLSMYDKCPAVHASPDGTPLEYHKCDNTTFISPKYEIKMKYGRPFEPELLKRMG
jgi:hypothetical protein